MTQAQIDPAIGERIMATLGDIERGHGVRIPLAVESGSRAWGFPSPDSDYDCRFVFVRPIAQHLTPWPKRDVIEVPLDEVLDVNGWDLAKAIKLLLKGNAVIVEWLTSPIRYTADEEFVADFRTLAHAVTRRGPVGRHYLHLGERQFRTYFGRGEADTALKKVFYALRPAAALRWLRIHRDQAVSPMDFRELLRTADIPPEVLRITDDLLAMKAASSEMGTGRVPDPIRDFIVGEYERAREEFSEIDRTIDRGDRERAEAFYRTVVGRLDAGSDEQEAIGRRSLS